ncbi:MAG: polysaccharide deacetylase family protein [Prolixibacteraceae bacterium]
MIINSLKTNRFLILILFFMLSAKTQAQPETQNTANKRGQITSFVYHRFGDDRYPSTNISVNDFRNHLNYLKNNNYNVLPLGKAVALLKSGETIPDKTVVLTIDDGYKSFFENGMPLLREFGYQATLFINTKQFGTGDFLSVKEIKQLINEGIEVENHSHSHAYFVNFTPEEIADTFKNDLIKSQDIFLKHFGYKPTLYAYPYGEYTPQMQTVLKNEGYIAAVAQKSGIISYLNDPYALPRFPAAGNYTNIDGFVKKINMNYMPVQLVKTVNPVIQFENPPALQLKLIDKEMINMSQIQCFVGGQKDGIISFNPETNLISVKSVHPLNTRRTLYTITAPSKTEANTWHWYSFLWINNKIEE